MYYAVQTRITPLTTIRRERLLPARGEVLVRPGEVVGSADVVARCQLPGKIHVVDASRSLRLRRERVSKYLRVAVDEYVQAGDVLAAPPGILGRLRNCRSPVDGQVKQVRSGLILIEATPATFELCAHLNGQISNVMPDRGVVVTTVGSLIQGAWGNGGEAEGVLKVVVDSPHKPLRARAIDVSCQGTLVVGGQILDEETFEQAIEAKVRGIIAGSASADLKPALEALPFPVVLTEGFGSLPLSTLVFDLLHSNMGRETMLNADTQTRWDVKRPEIVIPLRSEAGLPVQAAGPVPLAEGMKIKVIRPPHMGSIGTITHLPALPQTVESGVRLTVAEVTLDDDAQTLIPLANLEHIY